MTRVALLGLGRMGSAMAGHLVRAGHDLTVWNRTPQRAADLVAAGATQAATPAQAAADRDVVVLMLHGPQAVRSVLLGADGVAGGATQGTLVVDATTVGPQGARELDAAARQVGLRYLEAPVIGSVQPARAGTLGVLVGGAGLDVAEARPLLELWGDPDLIRHTGAVGTANALKLVVNLSLAATVAGIGEALRLGADLGVDPAVTLDLLGAGPSGGLVAAKRPMLARGVYTPPEFTMELLGKDLALALGAGRRPLPVTEAVAEAVRGAVAAGLGGADMAALASDPAVPDPS